MAVEKLIFSSLAAFLIVQPVFETVFINFYLCSLDIFAYLDPNFPTIENYILPLWRTGETSGELFYELTLLLGSSSIQ